MINISNTKSAVILIIKIIIRIAIILVNNKSQAAEPGAPGSGTKQGK